MPTAIDFTPGICSAGSRMAGRPRLAAYLRVLDPGRKFAEPSIGRVLTVPPHRGTGLGRVVMREGIVAHPRGLARASDPHRRAAAA